MSMRYKGGVISATAPTITPPVDGEGGTAVGVWTLQTQLQNSASWPKPNLTRELYSWGENADGQLGLGDVIFRSSPVQVGALTTWLNLAAGSYHSIATKTDGTLWTWGRNTNGQLGLGDTVKRSSPVQVGALTTWSKVSGGAKFSAAIKTDGTLWTWGNNDSGQLGLGDKVYRSSPVQVGVLTTWTVVACGQAQVLAVKSDGTLWAWGTAPYLPLNSGTYVSSPVQVGALTSWSSVSAGTFTAGAVRTNGTLWLWGQNAYGQVGINSTAIGVYSSPVQVGALTTWSNKLGFGTYHTAAIKTDGTLWTWGYNRRGQLGLNDSVYQTSSPIQVGALTTWSQVKGGFESTIATKTDKTLWAWGYNNRGQLGQNDTNNRSSPVQVGALSTWLNCAQGYLHTIANTVS